MSPQVDAAIISGVAAFAGVLVAEVFIRRRARKAKKESIESAFVKYAQPLAVSSIELFWRLQEVFGQQRSGIYLKGSSHPTRYEHYKALSTLYRMARLVGLIRALRRELIYIPGSKPSKVRALDEALNSFSSALAEGGHVEIQRVKSLIDAWSIDGDSTDALIAKAGSTIDRKLDFCIHENAVASIEDLPLDQKGVLVRSLAEALTDSLGRDRLAPEVVESTLDKVIASLAIREAYVYRDWQSAIGDVMLRESSGDRQFEVIGFKEFESICENGEGGDKDWLRRLNLVIDDLDVSGDELKDARINQLRDIHRASARIILALYGARSMKSRIPKDVRSAAWKLAPLKLRWFNLIQKFKNRD